jgi:mono/diheme cytochrome c family protein
MKTLLKLLALVVVLLVLAAGTIYGISEHRLGKQYHIDPEAVAVPSDPAAIEHGARIAKVRGCRECHGDDLAGATVVEDPKAGKIYGVNLTRGAGGLPQDYSDADFVRAIRHGVARDGHPLILMPSAEFHDLSDADVGAIIAYIRSVPPVDRQMPRSTLGPIMRTVLVLDRDAKLLPAESIDHARKEVVAPPATPAELGRYLAVACTFCHGDGFSGGKIPGVPPDWPVARNLTQGGDLKNWSEAQFVAALRTGVTPDGRKLPPQYMPWTAFQAMTDAEISALWQYLRSVPPRPDGSR